MSVAGFDWQRAIVARAGDCGVSIAPAAAAALARHARAVLDANPRLHLTTIVEPGAFLERHLGEGFEGAAMLDPGATGQLVDVGSGNGYPGLVLAAARPGLTAALAESSAKKAAFLRTVVAAGPFEGASVLERRVERAADLEDVVPVRVVAARAVGNWERIVPRLLPCLEEAGGILLWGGRDVEAVRGRASWRRLRLEDRRPLPARDRSWIWRFRPA